MNTFPEQPSRDPRLTRSDLGIAALLAAVAAVAFVPALGAGIIDLDDHTYVESNPYVLGGLTAENASWAFTTFGASNWHPLTWLSLQLDASLWGPEPPGFHRTNVLLHAVNAALLFFALRALTGARARSTVVAALFAVHPLRVESVAWISERKDVLSTGFGFLALWAYAAYAQRPSVWRYLAVAASLALSLLAKPMLVTLPFLMLVLDWWPLGRAAFTPSPLVGEGRGGGNGRRKPPPTLTLPHKGGGNKKAPASVSETRGPLAVKWPRLVAEKLPLFALCVGSCVVTLLAQRSGGAVAPLAMVSLGQRLVNAVIAYASYLRMAVWPFGLAPYYPYPDHGWPVDRVAGSCVALAGLTALAVSERRRRPYLLAGWLWFLGTLVPVIGLVQVGSQAYADRYTYFPLIGPCVALVWAVADLVPAPRTRLALAAAAGLVAVLAALTWRQAGFWHDDFTLWPHTIDVTIPNAMAECSLGAAIERKNGPTDEALGHYAKAVEAAPRYGLGQFNFAQALDKRGKVDEAIRHYQKALETNPGPAEQAETRFKLGSALARKGANAEAAEQYRLALRVDPDSEKINCNLGTVLVRLGRADEAIPHLQKALRSDPDDGKAHGQLGIALAERGDSAGALEHLRRSAELQPGSGSAQFNVGMALRKFGRRGESIPWFQRAVKLEPNDVQNLDILAAAYAEAGRFDEAIPVAERALAAAEAARQPRLAREVAARLARYRERRPPEAAPR